MARSATFAGDGLAAAVAAAGHPVGLDTLQARFPDVPRRTLQRRLGELVAAGRLLAEGRARARRYRVSGTPASSAAPLLAALEGYSPNLSFFLPRSLRMQLRESGAAPAGDAGIPFATFLAKARAIDDPCEQAFFIWMGLAYLQRMAGIPEAQYHDAVRALLETNRVQPLRDLFARAFGR